MLTSKVMVVWLPVCVALIVSQHLLIASGNELLSPTDSQPSAPINKIFHQIRSNDTVLHSGSDGSIPKKVNQIRKSRQHEFIRIVNGINLTDSPDDPDFKQLNLTVFNQTLSIKIREHTQVNGGFSELKRFVVTNSSLGLYEILFRKYEKWHLKLKSKSSKFSQFKNYFNNNTRLFVNEDNSTVLLVTTYPESQDSYVEMYGWLNDRIIVTPEWHQLAKRMRNITYNADNHQEWVDLVDDGPSGTALHIVIQNARAISSLIGFNISQIMHKVEPNRDLVHPGFIYPEVTLIVDYWSYLNHNKNIDEIWRYYVIFFSQLELLFKQLQNPQVNIRLKNIFIADQPFDFQLNSTVFKNGDKKKSYLNAMKAVHEFGHFFYHQRHFFTESDIVLVVTGQDLCLNSVKSSTGKYDSCSYSTIRGQSFVGGACRKDDAKEKNINVAVVEDSGFFDGVRIAAHEISHLLGALHDGQWPISGILGPGGRGCPANSGYLMSKHGVSYKPSNKPVDPNLVNWSLCSVEQFEYYFNLPNAMCLFNKPNDDEL